VQVGQLIDGRFRVERLERSGGMGAIYKARDEAAGRLVAIKTMQQPPGPQAAEDADLFARFSREAATLEQLDHPHIVRYVAHGRTEDLGARGAYIAMEWLDGETLGARVARGPLSIRTALEIGMQVADALAFAHARGIVHRDVKPANLMLCDWRADRIKLLDFGVARVSSIASELTGTGSMLGTPGYMSPEQARGEKPLDARTDVFALGCVLFAAIAGTPPYVADSVAAVLARLLEHDAPRLAAAVPGVPTVVDDLLFRMMSRQASARPQDGEAVRRAIATILPNLPEGRHSTIPPVIPTLSPRERVVASVVAVEAEAGDRFRVEAALAPLGLGAFGEQGYLFAVVSRLGAPHDHAMQASRVALALADGMPEAAIGVASGWLELDVDGRPHGDALERARSLAKTREQITLDEVTSSLLDDRFRLSGAFLAGRRDEGPADGPNASLVGRLPLRGAAGAEWALAGRTRELAQLQSLLDECVAEPIARVALIVGNAGVGKTRVLREFLTRVPSSVTVLASACERSRAGHPFAALPVLTTGGASRRGAALEEKLAAALAHGPVVVAIDDAQWGDDPSFRTLLGAAKKHASAPLLVLLCGRAAAKEAFFALGGRGAIAQEVLVTAPSRKLLDEIAARAKIDPAAASTANTPLELAALAAAPGVPWTKMFKQARLDAFEGPVRRVLRASATCPERFGERTVVATIGAPEEAMTVRLALDSLVGADVLAREGDTLHFTDAEMREAARGMLATSDAASV